MLSDSVTAVREVFGLSNRGQFAEASEKAEQINCTAARALAGGYVRFRSGDIINGTLLLREAADKNPEAELSDILIKLLIQFELHYPLHKLLSAKANSQSALSNEHLYHLVLSSQATGRMAESERWLAKLRLQATQARGLDLLEGHFAKSFARTDDAAQAYQRFIRECPQAAGTGFWSLCDLKGYRFSDNDEQLAESALRSASDPLQTGLLLLALSKMQADKGFLDKAREYLTSGNAQLARVRPFQKPAFAALVRTLCSTPYHLTEDSNDGDKLIFICGLPRSGTTLIEQILANCQQVEPTNELPFMERIALHLQMKGVNPATSLSQQEKSALRRFYLSQAEDFASKSDVVLIDKNPNNFMHHHLISTLFPKAKVINVLRPVVDNVVALYRQYFMTGNEYAYNLDNILTYVEGYYALLQHALAQQAAPLIIDYEALVNDPEQQVKALFDYCALPYTEDTLNFYQQTSPVLTPSASQVRQPINASSIGSGDKFSELLVPYQSRIDALINQRTDILRAVRG